MINFRVENKQTLILYPCRKIGVHNGGFIIFRGFSLWVQCVCVSIFANSFILWMLWNANPLPLVVHQRGEVSQGQGHLGLNAPYPTNKIVLQTTNIGPAFPNLPSQSVVFPWIMLFLGCISVLPGHQLLSRVLYVVCLMSSSILSCNFIYFQSL